MGKAWLGLVGGLAVILTGALLAWLVQTAGGVSVRDVRFAGDRGTTLAALVYMPASASAEHPAPAVLLSHGYINTREMQSAFAIELAALKAVCAQLDQSFDDAVEIIIAALKQRGKIVLVGIGKSGNVGAKIAATLTSTGSTAVVLNSVDALHGERVQVVI